MLSICPVCDCNGIAILTFLFGLIGGVLVNVVVEEGQRRKALKEQEADSEESEKDKLDGGGYV